MCKMWWKRFDFFFSLFLFFFSIISLRNGLTAPGWSMCLSQLLCHPGNHGDHDDRLDAIWSQPHKKTPRAPARAHMHTESHTHTKKPTPQKKNRQQMATRPLDPSPERASWGEGLRDAGRGKSWGKGGKKTKTNKVGREETKKQRNQERERKEGEMGVDPQLV